MKILIGIVIFVIIPIVWNFFKNASNNRREVQRMKEESHPNKAIDKVKKTFNETENRKIHVDSLNCDLFFNNFPFKSSFIEGEKELRGIDCFELVKEEQENYIGFWEKYELELKIIFNKVYVFFDGKFNREIYEDVYTNFLNASFNVFEHYFSNALKLITSGKNKNDIEVFLDLNIFYFDRYLKSVFTKIVNDLESFINEKQEHVFDFGWHEETNNNDEWSEEEEEEEEFSFKSFGMDTMLMESYKRLGVSPNVSNEELKKKYRALAKKYHPDVNKDDSAIYKMAEINDAYDRINQSRGI